MTLQSGRMLAHYRILEMIGEGGMGVVWKAEDTRLGRQVAIKILPPEFAEDRQRLARFEREAKLLAALNHPNVAAIYGFDSADGVHFLVLELVDGPTLAQMTKTGPLPVEEALDVCRQVAEGLEAAHGAGVIHRDLKPGNVIVTGDGKAKVLDFGLAKGLEGTAGGGEKGSDLSMSPTLAVGGTQAGVVLGTAPYMSPEQARGKTLDKRTDIWSFGCLLYECLAGRLVFPGETVTDTLSAILQNDPDWSALPVRTPRRIRDLLERCLEKSPRNRLHDMGDARIDLEKSLSAKEWTTSGIRAVETAARTWRLSRRGLAAGAVTILAIGILIGAGALALWKPGAAGKAPSPVRHLAIVPPPGLRIPAGNSLAILPHGDAILLAAASRDDPESGGARSVYLRRLDVNAIRRIDGSDGIITGTPSPDGRWLALVTPISPGSTTLQLVKVPVDGSAPPVRIADWPEDASENPLWLPSGEIAIVTGLPPGDKPLLHRVPVDGTPPSTPVAIDLQAYRDIEPLQALHGGRHLVAVSSIYGEWGDRRDALLLDMETGTLRLLVEDASPVFWSPTGHLLVGRGEAVLAVPFDAARLEITGGPVAIMDGIYSTYGRYNRFSISDDGTVVYAPATGGASQRRLAFVNRDGTVEAWSDERRILLGVEVSPDGRQIATTMGNADRYLLEIWISDVDPPRLRRLAAEPGMDCDGPVWSPGSERIAYGCRGSGDEGGIYVRRADGTGEPEQIVQKGSKQTLGAAGFTADGSSILVNRVADERQGIHLVPLRPDEGGSRKLTPVIPDQSAAMGRVSYDGRWVAYVSDETGRNEVYLRALGADGTVGRKLQISNDGGSDPRFVAGPARDPLEIYYVDGHFLMLGSVATEPAMKILEPRQVMNLDSLQVRQRSHLPGGRHLIVQGVEGEGETRQINVVLNFHDVIRRKFAGAE